eukprot:4053217-Amphidinium_carterae.1
MSNTSASLPKTSAATLHSWHAYHVYDAYTGATVATQPRSGSHCAEGRKFRGLLECRLQSFCFLLFSVCAWFLSSLIWVVGWTVVLIN